MLLYYLGESSSTIVRRTKTSQSMTSGSRMKMHNDTPLEIRTFQKEDSIVGLFKPDTDTESLKLDTNNKNALELMPKYVLKQINDRRQLNISGLLSANGSVSSAANVMNPHYLYNAKNSSELLENASKDLNRKATKNSKLQSHLIQAIQQKPVVQQPSTSTHSFQQSKNNSRSLVNLAGASNSNDVNQTAQSNLKTNEETINLNSSVNSGLFSTAFVSMNSQLKSQYDKLASRGTNVLPNNGSVKQKLSR